MNKEQFMHKYAQENSIKQVFLRKAYQNYFKLRSNIKMNTKQRINKSVESSQRDYSSLKFKTDQSKVSFNETSYRPQPDKISQMSEFHYNILRNKWLVDDKSNVVYIRNLQQKKRQLEIEEQQRQIELNKIQQAIQLRENIETDRKRQFYMEAEKFRNQQSERKCREQEKVKTKELEYMQQAKQMAEHEQLEQLEQQIIHRQKCKLQFQMLENQRRTNSFLFP